MEQWLIAALALVGIVVIIAIFEVWRAEREIRNEYEPTETGVLPREPLIVPMPPVKPTKGRRPF